MCYDDQLVFRTSKKDIVAAKTVLELITPLIRNNEALAPALRRMNAVLTVATVQEQFDKSASSDPNWNPRRAAPNQSKGGPSWNQVALSQNRGGPSRNQGGPNHNRNGLERI